MMIHIRVILLALYVVGLTIYIFNLATRSPKKRAALFWYMSLVMFYLIHGVAYYSASIVSISMDTFDLNRAFYHSWKTWLNMHLIVSIIAKEIVAFVRRKAIHKHEVAIKEANEKFMVEKLEITLSKLID